jgi:catechol 2,3-dioxygenase-like lactoylglutathione lyase family enzyme
MKVGKATATEYPGTFHIGFFVADEATVDEINRRLKDDGYEVTAPSRHHGYTFYVTAPGGFTVELGA